MKSFLLVVSIMFAMTTNQFAQPDGRKQDPEKRATAMVKNLEKELSLTEDQSSKIKTIQLETLKKVDELREQGMAANDKKAMRQKVNEANDAADEQVKALLTADQKLKYEAWQIKRQEEMKNRGPKPGGN